MTKSKLTHEERYAQLLLARRVPRADIEIGRAYVIHARNGGVGVAVKDHFSRAGQEGERLGYQLHREKCGHHYLFVEDDWDNGPPFGTVIPLAAISDIPPKDDAALLAWLSDQETKHQTLIDGAWQTVLGFPVHR